ncbi:hypothetical protein KAX75_01885 [candidate division WOR-3 bacterium]|nr:hypothetical protein [candidate division WOR-3 bacterium]
MKVGLISNSGLAKDRFLSMLTNGGINIEYIPPPYVNDKVDGFDIIHLFPGYFLLKTSLQIRLKKKRIVNHWIGTDVTSAIKFHKRRLSALLTDKLFKVQLAVSPTLVKELKSIGISAKVLPNVPAIPKEVPINFPTKKRGVMIYLPEDRSDFHRGNIVMRLAALFPSINFHIVANNGDSFEKRENAFFHGWVSDKELEDVWSKVDVLLRIPKHDGLPLMILEALAREKYVIWNYPFEHCYRVKGMKDIVSSLKDALEKSKPNKEARIFVLKNYNPVIIAKEYKKIYKSLLR